MPAPWAAGAQVRIIGQIHGQETINVINFATNSVINDDFSGLQLLKDLANAVAQCVQEALIGAVSSNWVFNRCDVKKLSPTVGDAIDSDPPTSVIGSLSATSVSFAAALVRISTGGGGRSGRGRMFLPPPGESEISASEIDPATLLLIAAFCACMATKFIGASAETPWRLGVLSRKKVNDVLPPFDNRFREAVALTPVSTVAIMGSRKKGRGA
jgi:hypothetical protein